MSARPVTEPITCQPWCEDGDGHVSELFAEDQRCESEHRQTFPQSAGEPDYDQVTAFARQRRDEPAVVALYIYFGSTDEVIELTTEEARQVAANLIAVADEIEAVQR